MSSRLGLQLLSLRRWAKKGGLAARNSEVDQFDLLGHKATGSAEVDRIERTGYMD